MKKLMMTILISIGMLFFTACDNSDNIDLNYKEDFEHTINNNYTYKFIGESEHFYFQTGKVYYNGNERELLISNFKLKKKMDSDTTYSVNLYFNEKLLYGTPDKTSGFPMEYFENVVIGEHGYLGDKDQNGNIIGESDSFLETTKDTFKESIKLEITYCLKDKCSTETLDLKYIEEE